MVNFTRDKIYKKEPPATQSGNKNIDYWILEPDFSITNNKDSLMGWSGGGDVRHQIKIKFSTLKEAENYAKKNDIDIEHVNNNKRSVKKKSYAENFK